jgi:methylmalonyl-CoA mutase
MCQEQSHPDLAQARQSIADDLAGGATSLLLRLDQAARAGRDPDDPHASDCVGVDGLTVYHLDDWNALLGDVNLESVGICLDAGAAFLPAAAILAGVWHQRGIRTDQVSGAFNADPLAVLARDGLLPFPMVYGLALLSDLAAWTAQHVPQVTAVAVDTSPYHEAGASAIQEVAFALATAVQYLRAMTEGGLSIDEACRQIRFSFRVDTDHFLSISKLRAARRAWWRVVEACGGSAASGATPWHVRIGNRVLTQRDPYLNLLRNAIGIFAAGIGGADVITSVPFDDVIGLPTSFSRRLARNTVLILQEEAHLHRVIDPAGGCWYLDSLTDQVVEKSWCLFQEIEQLGGMAQALHGGWVAQQIKVVVRNRDEVVARRERGITGVTEFPDVNEIPIAQGAPNRQAHVESVCQRRLSRRPGLSPGDFHAQASKASAAVAAAQQGASIGQLAHLLDFFQQPMEIAALPAHRLAEPFEQLRDASDAWKERQGSRPAAFLAKIGPVQNHAARAAFAKNVLQVAGFDVVDNDRFGDAACALQEYTRVRTPVVVICGSDNDYPNIVPKLARDLKAAGARSVALAGRPGSYESTWRTAGVDQFIFAGCHVLVTLCELLAGAGVVSR